MFLLSLIESSLRTKTYERNKYDLLLMRPQERRMELIPFRINTTQ